MCGVVAILSRVDPPEQRNIRAALAALRHRGPDGSGSFESLNRRVVLGHTRLAVTAPQDGAQPIPNEDGSVVAVVNGQFYGFEATRRGLEQRGHRFRTRSDSEVLVHLYEEHGLAFVHHLRGEFAFLLWDETRSQIVAGRDRFGVKPLVYAEQGDSLSIASESKALFALGVPAAWDHDSLEHAFSHQYLPPHRTLFRGIKALPPGRLLVATQLGPVSVQRYWDLELPASEVAMDDREAARVVRAGLDEAVRLRARADVPVAFHLSGGLDSASILALAAQASPTPLHAFTVGFQHPPYDEADLARQVAAALGVTLHVVDVSQDALLEALSDAVFYGEGLCINGQLPSKLILARAIAAQGFKVSLSGEGADEAFLGYAHLAWDHCRTTTGAREQSAPLARSDVAQLGVMLPEDDTPDLPEARHILGYVPTFLTAKAAFGLRLRSLLSEDAQCATMGTRAFQRLFASLDVGGQLRGRPPVLQSAYLWTRLALAGYILRTLGDGTEMAASIEGRTPFLDHVLFERVRSLPISLKLRHGIQKYVLREAVRDLLPSRVLARRKHPFLAPPITHFRSSRTREFVLDILGGPALRGLPLVDAGKVQRFAQQCFEREDAGGNTAEPVLMTLLSACLLQERFSLGEGG